MTGYSLPEKKWYCNGDIKAIVPIIGSESWTGGVLDSYACTHTGATCGVIDCKAFCCDHGKQFVDGFCTPCPQEGFSMAELGHKCPTDDRRRRRLEESFFPDITQPYTLSKSYFDSDPSISLRDLAKTMVPPLYMLMRITGSEVILSIPMSKMSIHPSAGPGSSMGLKVPLSLQIIAFDPDKMMSPFGFLAGLILSGPLYDATFDVWEKVQPNAPSYFTQCNDQSTWCLCLGNCQQASTCSNTNSLVVPVDSSEAIVSSSGWNCTDTSACEKTSFIQNTDWGYFWQWSPSQSLTDCANECATYIACQGIEFYMESGKSFCIWWKARTCSKKHASWQTDASISKQTCIKIQTTGRQVGSECETDSQCGSESCKGRCCGAKGADIGCTKCGPSGNCATCSAGYTFSEYITPNECFNCSWVDTNKNWVKDPGEKSGLTPSFPCIIPKRNDGASCGHKIDSTTCMAVPLVVDRGQLGDWYDIQGCGKCQDYCRWVGRIYGMPSYSQDPNINLRESSPSSETVWSCTKADGKGGGLDAAQFDRPEDTATYYGKPWSKSFKKCTTAPIMDSYTQRLTGADSQISTFNDLKGKQCASGTCGYISFRSDWEEPGVSTADIPVLLFLFSVLNIFNIFMISPRCVPPFAAKLDVPN